MPLAIAPNFALPDDAVTQTFAILAKRGVGKTYTASVMAEEMAYRGLPFVAIDPIGVWWGLRAEGRADGLPIPVLGGDHGDVPITPEMGAEVAELIASERLTCVIDLGPWRKGQAIKFMTAFAETLYRKNRRPLHLFLDEADAYAPQRTQKGEGAERLLGAIEDIVRRGRARGLGATLISQRPAVLNKNVLTQIETLVIHRITSPQDRKAIDDWVKLNAEVEEAVESTLPGLAVGEAWWWSPAYLGVLEKVQTRERNTFDSSTTPDDVAVEPHALADIDLSGLHAQFEQAIEEKKANDPAELRKQVRDLKADNEKLQTAISTLEEQRADLEARLEEPRFLLPDELIAAVNDLCDGMPFATAPIRNQLDTFEALAARVMEEMNKPRSAPPRKARVASPAPPTSMSTTPREPAPPREVGEPTDESLSRPQQRILDTLAMLEQTGQAAFREPSRRLLALFCEVSPRSSGYEKNLSTLRTAGLVEYGSSSTVRLTPEGRGTADEPGDLPTLAEFHGFIERLVSRPQWTLLHILARAYPHAMSRETLAEAADVSERSSGFEKNLSTLKTLGFLVYPGRGEVAATPTLMMEG